MVSKHVEPNLGEKRGRAEDRPRQRPATDAPGAADTQRLLHELQVHQIELETQNETLRQAQVELESLANKQAAHLRELASDLTRAEQRERDRLYELLHDEVQPLLVATRLSLSGLNPRTVQEDGLRVAAEACEHLSRIIQLARSFSLQLSPPLIRERGLNAALASLCRWLSDNHALEVELSSAPDADPDDMALRLLCFNAARELLLNVAKHAGTSRVSLALRRADADTLLITVADHGSGFDPAALTHGSGLASIARRLGMIGGTLSVNSHPGTGTVTTLSVPLRPITAAGWTPGSPDRRKGKEESDAQDTDRG